MIPEYGDKNNKQGKLGHNDSLECRKCVTLWIFHAD